MQGGNILRSRYNMLCDDVFANATLYNIISMVRQIYGLK